MNIVATNVTVHGNKCIGVQSNEGTDVMVAVGVRQPGGPLSQLDIYDIFLTDDQATKLATDLLRVLQDNRYRVATDKQI